MKKIIALFLALGISMTLLAGCGDDSSEKSGSASNNTTEEESQYQIEWPDSGLAALLPAPKSNMLRNIYDSSSSFYVEVEETSTEDFNEYVKACQDRGFTVDYYKMEDDYSAENEDGVQLDIFYYSSQEVMEINLLAPRNNSDSSEAETAEAESEPEPDTQVSQSDTAGIEEEDGAIETQPVEQEPAASDSSNDSSDTVDPSVKDALDSYESFMDEYVAFMQKYKNSTDVTSMLSDYADYMAKYSEAVQKLNDMDTENFSAADWNYYIEVTSRVADKLADAA